MLECCTFLSFPAPWRTLTRSLCYDDNSYRLFGLFPILQWAQSLNDPASAPKDKWLRIINKAQVWSMLMYYPMEHYCESQHDEREEGAEKELTEASAEQTTSLEREYSRPVLRKLEM
jgi:hypothetical protein